MISRSIQEMRGFGKPGHRSKMASHIETRFTSNYAMREDAGLMLDAMTGIILRMVEQAGQQRCFEESSSAASIKFARARLKVFLLRTAS
jgi:hypothetical protein